MTRLKCFILTVGLILLAGCTTNPNKGPVEPLVGADREVSVMDVQMLRRMDRTPVLDPELNEYMQRIRQRLEQAWGVPCDCVVVVDSFSGYEAYNLSSATIVVSSGLVAQAHSEDEIAAVIAHELGHAYSGDSAKGVMQQFAVNATKLGSWVAGAGGYTLLLGETVDDVANGLIYRRWNQEQEIAADRFAAEMLVKAGYSLDGLKMAVRRLGRYGESVLANQVTETPACITGNGSNYTLDFRGCSRLITRADESFYQTPALRLRGVLAFSATLPPEQRRRRPGGPVPDFASVDYLFELNNLVTSDEKRLTAALARIEAQPMPASLDGNVAITNKLAMAQAIAGDSKRARAYLEASLQSENRTAWTFNMLFKEVDRSGDPDLVMSAIQASHREVGFMPQLLPIEYYLAKRHGLKVYETISYVRCISNLVDDLKTFNTCAEFEKLASSYGSANW